MYDININNNNAHSVSILQLNLRHRLVVLWLKADTHFTTQERVEGWVDLGDWLYTGMVTHPQTVTHLRTDRVCRNATTLISSRPMRYL